jgi:hypothetical protein
MADMVTDKTNRVLEQYGGAFYERNGPDVDSVEWKSAPNTCLILPPQAEQVHPFARIPLITQGLRDQVQILFQPRQDNIMAPGVSTSRYFQQYRIVPTKNKSPNGSFEFLLIRLAPVPSEQSISTS